jgi:two-component system, chemotaxis family, CheB/CheR fusion protein
LDLSRIESGKLELNKSSFDLGELVQESVQDAYHTSNKHKITVHQNFKGTVFADRDRISQVLINLLTNAIKYSPHESAIDVTVEGKDEKVSIEVKDRGIGINKKDQHMIFQRFYRVEGKSEQTYPGFGIGLFITAEIIQRHNGSISVESNMDEGAIFKVILPIGQGKRIKNLMKTISNRILVLDDDPDIGIMIKRRLEYHGYAVLVTQRAEQAELLIATEDFNLLIMDMLL